MAEFELFTTVCLEKKCTQFFYIKNPHNTYEFLWPNYMISFLQKPILGHFGNLISIDWIKDFHLIVIISYPAR